MPELTGTLDTSVNGPEGLPSFDGDAWERVDWRFHEEQVRRLRGRIFKAVQAGDWPLARNLQKLALRSWSNTLVSVRQVTQRNTGRRTAGIDGQVALTSQARAEVAVQVHATVGSHRPFPGPGSLKQNRRNARSAATKYCAEPADTISVSASTARVTSAAGDGAVSPVRADAESEAAGARLYAAVDGERDAPAGASEPVAGRQQPRRGRPYQRAGIVRPSAVPNSLS